MSPIKFEEKTVQIFHDLSQETFRSTLKPLLKVLQEQEIQYNWGFPACLIGMRNGRTVKLRFIEETTDFCNKLEIPIPDNTRKTTLRQEDLHKKKSSGN